MRACINNQQIRHHNKCVILELLYRQKRANKSTLARLAQISIPAVSNILQELESEKRVVNIDDESQIVIKTFDDKAPETVKNFLDYCREGFYNNTIFHRVINGFMIQGGGFEPGMKQKATKEPIKNEANNGLKNTRGTLAMARTQAPHSATAQFFINVVDNDFLNFSGESLQGWGYCVFAEVVDGMDVVDKIKGVATGRSGMHQDVPKEDVIIESVTVSE